MAVPHLQVQEGGLEPQFTLDEVAAAARVSKRTIEREIEDGNLGATKIRGATRVPLSEYNAWRKRSRLQ